MKSIGVGILPIHGTTCVSGHSLIEPNFSSATQNHV